MPVSNLSIFENKFEIIHWEYREIVFRNPILSFFSLHEVCTKLDPFEMLEQSLLHVDFEFVVSTKLSNYLLCLTRPSRVIQSCVILIFWRLVLWPETTVALMKKNKPAHFLQEADMLQNTIKWKTSRIFTSIDAV